MIMQLWLGKLKKQVGIAQLTTRTAAIKTAARAAISLELDMVLSFRFVPVDPPSQGI